MSIQTSALRLFLPTEKNAQLSVCVSLQPSMPPLLALGKQEKCESVTAEKVWRLHHGTDVLAQFALLLLFSVFLFFLRVTLGAFSQITSEGTRERREKTPPSFSCAWNAKVSSGWRRFARDNDKEQDKEASDRSQRMLGGQLGAT